jgi:hypothetical protein
MPMTARLRVAASLLVITIAAACGGDSTGPSQSPSSVAAHFDSLYVQAAAHGDSSNAYSARSLFLSLFELPPALGASPASITVTTAGGVEHWKAFEFVDVTSNSSDSGFFFLAYRENAAHTILLAEYNGDGTSTGGALVTNDTLVVNVTNGTGSTSLTSTSATCGTPSASLVNPEIPTIAFSSCHLAKFLTTLSLTTQTSASIDPALASISISSATVNGVRLVDQSEAATLRRVRALMHSARAGNRL